MDGQEYPERPFHDERTQGNVVWQEGGLVLTLVRMFLKGYDKRPHYNGYVRFPIAPLIDYNTNMGLYIPARGGLTFGQVSADGSGVYGFDTYHYWDDDDVDVTQHEAMQRETRMMARLIALAVPFEYAIRQRFGLIHGLVIDPPDGMRAITDAYDEQARYLKAQITGSDPLPDDFWARVKEHPLLSQST